MVDRSYAVTLQRLYALAPRGIQLGLQPVRDALAYFGDPQQHARVIHIAGTNGKGSTSAMIERALRSAGRQTGLYTSPHLHRFAERIQIQGQPASTTSVHRALERVFAAMDTQAIGPLTFFEVATVAAWLCFAEANVQDVVLEVGLGGRLDATNVCAPAVCAITRIALDHQALLGDTIAQIASEKAGIIKPRVPVILGPSLASGPAHDTIVATARAQQAPLHIAPELSFSMNGAFATVRLDGPTAPTAIPSQADPSPRNFVGKIAGVSVPHTTQPTASLTDEVPESARSVVLGLAGAHQVQNASTAITVLTELAIAQDAVLAGLRDTVWPARYERIGTVMIDAAHNPDGAIALRAALDCDSAHRENRAVVFGASNDKDWPALVDALRDWAPEHRWFLCAAGLSRATDPALLHAKIHGVICSSVREALRRAQHSVGSDGTVVVYGSIFVAAEARAALLGLDGDPLIAM
jgi:dihydrofolate synthase/folylpolyglutamate synthase